MTRSRVALTGKRWAAIAAAVAIAVGGGALGFVGATGGGATASSFVPITPCRLLDTRSTSPVGPRTTPILAGESLTVQVTGSNGSCVIPASATAIVINVTAVSPTAAGYITLFPADVALPNASNLNFGAGQNPTPNLVTVSLSAGGAIKIFNAAGMVNVLGDIAGYYQPDTGAGSAGVPCTVGGLAGVIVPGYDHDHNQSTKCFTSLASTLAGNDSAGGADGVGGNATFNTPAGVAVDSDGNLYVADYNGNRIRKITSTGVVTTFAGSGTAGHANGIGIAAQFDTPRAVAVDSVGNVYVADTGNHRIRKITPTGLVSDFAGDGTNSFLDGAAAAAQFKSPYGVAVDYDGNVYVADSGNHRIRKITAGVVSTLAGQTVAGAHDGTGAAAEFNGPAGVAVDAAGNVYVADQFNALIRKVTANGVVTTMAGSTQGFADGVGAAARFASPTSVAVDSAGNVFVADADNNRIRMVTPDGRVTTVAGSTPGFADGVGAAAQFLFPNGVAVDSSGTIFVAASDGRIRRIS